MKTFDFVAALIARASISRSSSGFGFNTGMRDRRMNHLHPKGHRTGPADGARAGPAF